MKTDELIEYLVRDAHSIRSLPAPWWRAVEWLAIALPAIAVAVALQAPRDDLAENLFDFHFLTGQAAAFASAVTAAAAAFVIVIPGRDRRAALLPLALAAVWLGILGQEAWLKGLDASRLTDGWVCFPEMIIAGAIPALTMVVMLRRGVPLAPRVTMLFAIFASAALASVGLRLVHPQDADFVASVWQFGSVLMLSVLASWGGPDSQVMLRANPCDRVTCGFHSPSSVTFRPARAN